MKTIGLLGGMSWESSIEYYRIINELTRDKLGGLHSAKSVMVSVDFAAVEELQSQNRWDEAARVMIKSAQQVEAGGADFLLIATNTMHKVYDEVKQAIGIPMLHIADATAEKILDAGMEQVGLLGTTYTMEQDFYKDRLIDNYGLGVLIPEKADRQLVNRVIFEELVLGVRKPESKSEYLRITQDLIDRGAQGVILGCTEIPLLIEGKEVQVPIFDTTYIHAEMAVKISLGERTI